MCRLAVYKVIYRDGGFLSDVLAGIDQVLSLPMTVKLFPEISLDELIGTSQTLRYLLDYLGLYPSMYERFAQVVFRGLDFLF
jgi:hypothetical protein